MNQKAQQLVQKLQMHNQQLQQLSAQEQQLQMQKTEISNALEELDKVEDEDVFKMSGPLMISADKEEAKQDLNDQKDEIDAKLKTVGKQREKLEKKVEEGQEQIKQFLPQQQN